MSFLGDLVREAACVGEPPGLMTSPRYEDHLAARTFCNECPVRTLCLDVIRPRQNWFDGTAGGRYWLDGIDMSARLLNPRFKPVSRYAHGRRTGSWRVREALAGKRDVSSLNETETMLFAYAAAEAGIPYQSIASIVQASYAEVRLMAAVVSRDAPERVIESTRTWRVLLTAA